MNNPFLLKSKKVILFLLKSIGIFIAALLIYAGAVWCLAQIKVGGAVRQDQPIALYLSSNGVHLDLVVPATNEYIDWKTLFPGENNRSGMAGDFVALGWGDKGFYMDTPTWADLKASTAFKAAFALGSSALHVTYYDTMTASDQCKRITVTPEQYQRLIAFVKESLDWSEKGTPMVIQTNAQYGDRDAFYEASGSYSLFQTCNTWTNEALQSVDAPACLFTLYAGPVMDKYR